MEIRPYRLEDYEQVRKNLEDGNLLNADIDTAERFAAKIRKDPESILVAAVDDKVVGNIFIIDDGWRALLFRLAVNKEYRECGIGNALLETAEKAAKARGHEYVSFFADDKNTNLKEFYHRRGYSSDEGTLKFMFKRLEKESYTK